MKNCKRYGSGGLTDGQYGIGQIYPQSQPGEQDEYASLAALTQQAGQIPGVSSANTNNLGAATPKKKMDWASFLQSAGIGGLMGASGMGNAGIAMAPIMALLMQLGKNKSGTSAKTPPFVPYDKQSGE